MKEREVAVIDIGSKNISVVVGERGINKTFVIKGEQTFSYEGFLNGEFLDDKSLKNALISVTDFLRNSFRDINKVYVGVPGDFTQVVVKDSQISFAKKKKIDEDDINALFDATFMGQNSYYTLINRSAILYELDDYRRLANPLGAQSVSLKGKLSFVLCSNYFLDKVKNQLLNLGFVNVECVSTSIAETMYLIDPETRDRIVELLDIDYISATFSIIQGDGIIFQKSFPFGGGYITGALVEGLNIDFDEAEQLKNKINLSSLSVRAIDVLESDKGKLYNVEEIKKVMRSSLDILCEYISNAIDDSGYSVPEYVPLLLTGGGINKIRGAKEHIANRLNCSIELVAPSVPMQEKPEKSSVLSLLDIALEQSIK